MDAPSAVILCGALAALASWQFAVAASVSRVNSRVWLPPPLLLAAILALLAFVNSTGSWGVRPLLVKDGIERSLSKHFVSWNSYSRVIASYPEKGAPVMWGASRTLPPETTVSQSELNIDGAAGTMMFHYDGTAESIDFLKYDLVNLAYHLPGRAKIAVIGVGGGRDILSAHAFNAKDITGIELNSIFVDLHTINPLYSKFSNLKSLPNLKLYVDDARSWFAGTRERFDLIQMSMIDTWASTGAGAYSLSENGLYTLEGWQVFLNALNPDGIFTVSRWYSPGDVNETGRMVSLATAALLSQGISNARDHIYIATAGKIATLVLSIQPFSGERLQILNSAVDQLGFDPLISPDRSVSSIVLDKIIEARSIEQVNAATTGLYLNLTVPTDNQPFFFNQLKFQQIPAYMGSFIRGQGNTAYREGVIVGNLAATVTLLLILLISLVAVTLTILLPLRHSTKQVNPRLIILGSGYFSLIGLGFMMAEIGLLQYFNIFLGHPVYSLGICLFSLILATGCGSFLSERYPPGSRTGFWILSLLASGYLLSLPHWLPGVFYRTLQNPLIVRIGIALLVLIPLGVMLGFFFPTGLRLTRRIDDAPSSWFWGINGVSSVVASVLAVICSIGQGISATMTVSGICYLLLLPIAGALLAMTPAREIHTALQKS
jgi:hypothetical protein